MTDLQPGWLLACSAFPFHPCGIKCNLVLHAFPHIRLPVVLS
ncbi:uncharacterized protein J3R85_009262 [Psidium guajava]|nr:uncharacterized protein J3R85_009262 [Psidium guajava]